MSDNFRFLVDENLLGLLRWLRIVGVDSTTLQNVPDDILIKEAERQKRLLLTRDRRLAEVVGIARSYYVNAEDPRRQLLEVLRHFDVRIDKPLSRCFACNTPIEELSKEEVKDRVDAKTWAIYDRFYECPHCRHIFWEGSHYGKLQEQILLVKKDLAQSD